MTHGELYAERLTHSVIGAFYEVYHTLGFGFVEHLYVAALERELLARGHRVGREVAIPVFYKGQPLGTQRLDMVVDEMLVVEVKSTYDLPAAARRQLLSYLSATRLGVGLLLHFGPEPKVHRCERRKYAPCTTPRTRARGTEEGLKED
ncbi:GxxExxY protein (plasmid) [Gemmatirosa kalamazoonensis]|uniref:GxxExxY protein n=1 Tax=Gemmatirosa kalamazoonensis TaxID=861299 RepID=W0RQ22_9BACT|nr:GxxExxY protein [Gemmatirosa kalamazoonensis]AHG93099.1 GxxExxY protein [Gemmatirosa kalamazoonensis]